MATEKKRKSIFYKEHSTFKIEKITDNIGMVYSGIRSDYRVLIKRARKAAHEYKLYYGLEIPTAQLVSRVAAIMKESGNDKPFWVSLLICGWDQFQDQAEGTESDREMNPAVGSPSLFQCYPTGDIFAWKATAMGKNYGNGITFLEKRFDDNMELKDAVHTAILTLKEGFEGQMSEDNIEIGICNPDGFRRLSPQEVKDYLANIALERNHS